MARPSASDGATWSVKAALDWTTSFFTDRDVDSPRRSAEWLLSSATGLSRVELYAYHDRPLTDAERTSLRESVRRRAEGEPLQFVTGEMPFRHVVIHVKPGVLIPRPETELLVEEGLTFLRERSVEEPVVVDVCTGSGCVAVSVAQEFPSARVWATDISAVACEVAEKNAERLGLESRINVREGDLFAPLDPALQGSVDLVLANPPYVPSTELPGLPPEVADWEPALALDGGADGLGVARRIMRDGREWLAPGGLLAMELDETRVQQAAKELQEWYEEVRVFRDLAGRDRIVSGKARSVKGR